MELRQLRYFVAVAEELNFSRAAGRMYLSQPALSQQIRKLERELGVALFDRTKNHVALTEAGLVLLEGARRVLVMVEQTAREAREVGGAEVRHLRVGFPEYANHTPVADALQTFRRRYPYVELEEHETFTLQETLQQIDKLHRGTLDVGFMLRPEGDDVLEVEHVLDIELVAALPAEHPLAGRDQVHLRELSEERLILFSRTFHPRSYDYVVGCCREAGFEPKVVQRKEPQLYSGATTYRMVASGIGVGIVAKPVVSGYRPYDVVFKPLREPAPALDLVAAWRRDDPSSNLQAFLEIVRELTRPDDWPGTPGSSSCWRPEHPAGGPASLLEGPGLPQELSGHAFREERRATRDLMELNRRDEARQYAEDARARPQPAGPSPEGTRQQMTAENPQDPERRRT